MKMDPLNPFVEYQLQDNRVMYSTLRLTKPITGL